MVPDPDAATDAVSRAEIRDAVREAVRAELWSIVSRLFWTVVAGFSALIGVNLVQFGYLAFPAPFAAVLAGAGALLLGLSVWLVLAEWHAFPRWFPAALRG